MTLSRTVSPSGKWVILLLSLALGGTAVVVAFRVSRPPEGSSANSVPAELISQLRLGHEKQLNRDWEAAQAIFQDLKRKLSADSQSFPAIRDEVARNLRLLEVLVSTPPVAGSIAVPPQKRLPPQLSEAMLLEHYPVGKTVYSHSHFLIEGKGHNTAWGTKAAAAFSYCSELPVETRVIESASQKGRLVFEQTFGDVLQICAVSDRTLELVSPDSIAARAWASTVDHALHHISPGYRQFRNVAEAISAADPGLKRVLTTLSESLRRAGVSLQPSDQVSFAVQAEKLTGTKLRIVYVSGLGVTHIAQLDEEHKLDEQELIRLAHASTVMVDHFVMPALKTEERDSWEVRAEDIGSLIALYDPSIQLGGSLQLHRAADAPPGKMAQLEVTGGSVTAHSESDQQARNGRLSIRDGIVMFDLADHFVDRAILNFSAQSLMQSRGHLLFGTEQLRDLKVQSRYQARLLHTEQTSPTNN